MSAGGDGADLPTFAKSQVNNWLESGAK